MSVLSEQPYELRSIFEWYKVNLTLRGFSPVDYADWCRMHQLCHSTDYSLRESEDLMCKALLCLLKTIYLRHPFDEKWLANLHRVFVPKLAENWELDMGSMHVSIIQRYCQSLSMNKTYGCYPEVITITGHLLGMNLEQKECIIDLEPKFDKIDMWNRLITKDGKGNGYIIAGPQY